MDCSVILTNVDKYTPIEYANLFVDFLIKNENCINYTNTISILKNNYYDYYVSIMMLIGKGG